MLILPESVKRQQLTKFHETRKAITAEYNKRLEKILSENSKHDRYWILGRLSFPDHLGGNTAVPFLEACSDKPDLVKNTFVYEVDNRRGVKELLWVCDDKALRIIPTNKTVGLVSPT